MENFEQNICRVETQGRLVESLNLAQVRKKREETEPINELVEEVGADLPAALKDLLMDDYQRIRARTEDESVIRETLEIAQNRLLAGFERRLSDNRKIPNESFAKLNAMEKIDRLFAGEKEPGEEDLKRVAHVFFDINGLKAVNDLGDHAKGDLYLEMAAEAIASPQAAAFAASRSWDFEPKKIAREGGDEFGAIIYSEQPIKKEDLAEFIKIIQNEFWDNGDVSRIMDFNNPEVAARYANADIKEISEKFGGDLKKFKEAKGIPANYRFRGAISAGAATLYDGLTDERQDTKVKIESRDTYHRMLQKMMGAMFSASDRAMQENKKGFKNSLPDFSGEELYDGLRAAGGLSESEARAAAEAETENMRFLGKVYSRTEGEKELANRIEGLAGELATANSDKGKMEDILRELRGLIDKGADKDALLKIINGK